MDSSEFYRFKASQAWTLILFMVAGLLSHGCTATSLMKAQQDVRQSFHSGDFDRSYRILNSGNFYRSNDQVLRNLELGTIHYFRGDYRESMNTFQKAENEIDRLFGISVERNIRAITLNEAQMEYQGEDYEDVMINIFNALSAVHLNDFEAALVETRRATHKLETLSIRYDGLVGALSREDTTRAKVDTANDWQRGSTNIQAVAFGHYLSYVIYANQGRRDDARIQFERFRREHNRMYASRSWFTAFEGNRAPGSAYPEPGNVMLLGFGGQAPQKVSNELRIYSNDLSTYIKFAVPSIRRSSSRIRAVEATVNDTLRVEMPLLDDFSMIAEDVFNVRRPLIITRSVIRSTLKYITSRGAQRAVSDEFGETAGRITGILAAFATEATEVADLRSWQSMPGKVYGQTVSLPEGTHTITIRYYGSGRNLLKEETKQVEVSGDRPLHITEALYWN